MVWRMLLGLLVSAAWSTSVAGEPFTFPGLKEQVVIAGFAQPVGATLDADGRIYVWEKAGAVWIVEDGVRRPKPLIDLSDEVSAYFEQGLIGFALDPGFSQNGLFYLLYVVDWEWHSTAGQPNPANLDAKHDTFGRLTRFAADPQDGFSTALLESRTVLIGQDHTSGFPITSGGHTCNALVFGSDGTLLASIGDGAQFAAVDLGGPRLTLFSTNTAEQDGILAPNEQVGAFRAQLVDSHSGKILRIDPDTGLGLPSNPFFDALAPDAPRSRVWALGLRNPFRFSVRPGTGSNDPADGDPGVLYIGDVGWNAWEEQDVCTKAGRNFGWPLYEGMARPTAYASASTENKDAPNPLFDGASCQAEHFTFAELLAEDSLTVPMFPNPCDPKTMIPPGFTFMHTRPVLDYRHGQPITRVPIFISGFPVAIPIDSAQSPVTGVPFEGNLALGGVWIENNMLGPTVGDRYVFAETVQGRIQMAQFTSDDQLLDIAPLRSPGGTFPVMLTVDAEKHALYYVHLNNTNGTGEVRRIFMDCDDDGVPDPAQIAAAPRTDLNGNGLLDACESLGDLNCDGTVSVGDINAFVLALTDPSAYAKQFAECDPLNADTNGDGQVSVGDINGFVLLVTGR